MNTEDFGRRRDEIPFPVYISKPQLGENPTSMEVKAYAARLEEYESGKAAREEIVKLWYAKSAVIEVEFKQALFKELGIEDNPKKDKLYSLAWESGHSGGFNDIFYHAAVMVALIK